MSNRKDPPNSWLRHELLQRPPQERGKLCVPLIAGFLWPKDGGETPHVTVRNVPKPYVNRFEELFERLVPYHNRAIAEIRSYPRFYRSSLSLDDLVDATGDPDPDLADLLFGLRVYLRAKLLYRTDNPRPVRNAQRLHALCVPIGEHCQVTADGLKFPGIGMLEMQLASETKRELLAVLVWRNWAERTLQLVFVSPRPALEDPELVQPAAGNRVVKLGVTFSKRQEALFLDLVRYHRLVFNRGIQKLQALKNSGQDYMLSCYDMDTWVTNAQTELGPDIAALKNRYGSQPARGALKQLETVVFATRGRIPQPRALNLTDPVISVYYPSSHSWKLTLSPKRNQKLYLQGFAQGPARKRVQIQGNIKVRGGPDALATLQAYRATSMKIVGWGTKLGRKYELQLTIKVDPSPQVEPAEDAPVVAIDRNVDSWGVVVKRPSSKPRSGKIHRNRLDDRQIRRHQARRDRARNVGKRQLADLHHHRLVVAHRRRRETERTIGHQIARGFIAGFSNQTLSVLQSMCGFWIPPKLLAELQTRPAAVVIENLVASSMRRKGKRNNHKLRSLISRFGRFGEDTATLQVQAGRAAQRLIKVDPRWTSQTCSKCGTVSAGSRKQAVFRCVRCRFALDADEQAAHNILARAESVLRSPRRGSKPATY